ncbi:MAG: hypothetical protein WC137_02785 [Alphaproteobacteria bacterium]
MKKLGIFIACTAMLMGSGAYAVYPAYNGTTQYVQYQQANTGYTTNNQGYVQQQYVPVSNNKLVTASNPNRVTGSLPRVGTSATTVGRQYYQSSDYDRLADSGLYIGLSIGYSTATSGGIQADYLDETNAFFAPGAFETADFKKDTILPLQLSIGAAINSDVRVDFSYSRYSGLSYADSVETGDGAGGYVDVKATGGAISSTATMLNIYYNLDSYTGYMAGGSMRPYVGVGLGISTNTIADYLVYDPSFYSEADIIEGQTYAAGTLTAISDIYAYHAGGTTEQLAYMLEGGLTTELEGGIKLDFFIRYSGMGKVQSSGSIVVSQTEWLSTGLAAIGKTGAEEAATYDSVFHYTNWFESGNIGTIDAGVRMRIQF